MNHRFCAIIGGKTPGLILLTVCYYSLLCLSFEPVDQRLNNIINCKSSSHHLHSIYMETMAETNWNRSKASIPAPVRTEIKLMDAEFHLLAPGISSSLFFCLLLQLICPRKEGGRKFLDENFQFLNRRHRALNSALSNRVYITSEWSVRI